MKLQTKVENNLKDNKKLKYKKNLKLFTMTLPGMIHLLLFAYLPMFGIIVAFKNFKYTQGIFGSPWCGLDNFMFLFKSNDFIRIIRNTLGYNIFFIFFGMFCSVFVAIMLFHIKKRAAIKFYQTAMLLPHFVSWVIVSYIAYIFLNPSYGLVNTLLGKLGIEGIQWYAEPKAWPFILTFFNEWKKVGMSCIMYYSVLIGIDTGMLEAAEVDGANKVQQIIHILIPTLVPTMIILAIMNVGSIFRGDFGLFYQLPRDVGVLYEVTDVLDTYIYRALKSGDIGMSSASGFLQSVVGFATVWTANAIVKKIDKDSAMF